jgi:hypothetical protein
MPDKENVCKTCQGYKRTPVAVADYPGGPTKWIQTRCPDCAGTGLNDKGRAAFEDHTTTPVPDMQGPMDYKAYVDKLRDERLHE